MTADRLEALRPDDLARVDELLDRASHDVAKYMAMTARNVDPAAIGDEERGMILEDLLRTDGALPAWELWRRISQELAALASDSAIVAVDDRMAALEALARRVEASGDGAEDLARATVEVADLVTGLRRAVRRRLMEVRS